MDNIVWRMASGRLVLVLRPVIYLAALTSVLLLLLSSVDLDLPVFHREIIDVVSIVKSRTNACNKTVSMRHQPPPLSRM